MERRVNNNPALARAFSRALEVAPVLPLAMGGAVAAYELAQPAPVYAQERGPSCVDSNSTSKEYWEICEKIVNLYTEQARLEFRIQTGIGIAILVGVSAIVGSMVADEFKRSRRG